MQNRHMLHDVHPSASPARSLLTALEVQELLHIDRSTVYRMADDGRLPSIRVGRARRFPADAIRALAAGLPATSEQPDTNTTAAAPLAAASSSTESGHPNQLAPIAQATIEVAADLLGVMMVVTDMSGRPVTAVANPCPWFQANSAVEGVLEACIAEWQGLAASPEMVPRFAAGAVGFQCARTFIRSGNNLVGMVLAGGISPAADPTIDPELHHLDPAGRERVLTALPRIAAAISTQVVAPIVAGDPTQSPPQVAGAK